MANTKQLTAPDIKARKASEKLTMLTAYDFPFAALLDDYVDMLLVGDTLGCVVQGNGNTLSVSLDECIYHARLVTRAAKHALVVGDLPFGSYQTNSQLAVESAIRLVKEAGVGAVKIEGGKNTCPALQRIVEAGIPTMGHIGLTPQAFHALGGNKVQGKQNEQAASLISDAKALEEAGAFAIVLEAIPASLAKEITEAVSIPTIGIGAGPACDGQVLVTYDMVGLNTDSAPMKFNKEFCQVRTLIREAAKAYVKEVTTGNFPALKHSYGLKQAV